MSNPTYHLDGIVTYYGWNYAIYGANAKGAGDWGGLSQLKSKLHASELIERLRATSHKPSGLLHTLRRLEVAAKLQRMSLGGSYCRGTQTTD